MLYSLRALFGYSALAWLVNGWKYFADFADLEVSEPASLFTPNLGVKAEVRRFAAMSLGGVLILSAAVALQGFALLLDVKIVGTNAVPVLMRSTWALWAIATVIGTMMLGSIISSIQQLLALGKELLEAQQHSVLSKLEVMIADSESATAQLQSLKTLSELRQQLRATAKEINASALPGGAIGLAGAVVLQIAGVLSAVAAVFRAVR